jgi:prepilin peptidase CpaA
MDWQSLLTDNLHVKFVCLVLIVAAVGGMGAGDVKLMAGVGAWLGPKVTWYAFCVSAVVGAVMAVLMVLWKRSWQKHYSQFLMIAAEWMTAFPSASARSRTSSTPG